MALKIQLENVAASVRIDRPITGLNNSFADGRTLKGSSSQTGLPRIVMMDSSIIRIKILPKYHIYEVHPANEYLWVWRW